MKLKCFLICTLCSIFACSSSAEDETKNYTITPNKDTIIVYGDCTIPVEEFAPENTHIYGNKEKGGYNSTEDLFASRTNKLNGSIKGVTFYRGPKEESENKKKSATLDIQYGTLSKGTIIVKFYKAKTETKTVQTKEGNKQKTDWVKNDSRDSTFQIAITKYSPETSDASQPTEESADTITNKGNPYYWDDHIAQYDEFKKEVLLPILILIMTCFIGLFLYLYRKQKKDRAVISALEDKLDNLTKGHHDRPQQVHSHVVQSDANKMNDVQIKQFIIEQIQYGIAQYVNSRPKPLSQPSPLPNPSTGKTDNQADHWTDTDNVKYNQSDNSFSIEDTTTHIFRLYKKNGNYYYTLVEDPDIREQLLGMLSAFEKCIAYQSSENTAKSMEPVRPGKLRKEGNKFYIDAKLEVRFI